jgi:hypothetical protein
VSAPVLIHPDEPLPHGADLIEEGLRLGAIIDAGRCAFCRVHGIRSEIEWKRARMRDGELQWSLNMGLASLEEQVEALRLLHRSGADTGVVVDRALVIPNWLTGLPEHIRERAPS